MRLATWNVDSVRARLDLVCAWIDLHEPDVLALQETKVPSGRFPKAAFAERGFEAAAHGGSGGRGGVALLSRVGLVDVEHGIPGAQRPLDEARSISATCNGVRLHTAYAPNGRKVGTDAHASKIAWLTLLRHWISIDGLADRPTVLLGDLNVAPTDLDVWDPHRYRKRNLTSSIERQTFQDFLDDGMIDVVRSHLPDAQLSTWWNRRGDFFESDRGWRLDHILTDSHTAEAVSNVWIDRDARALRGCSDHAPLVVDLERD